MTFRARYGIILIIGLVLVLAPLLVRILFLQYNRRDYTPPEIPPLSLASTPIPTAVPSAVPTTAVAEEESLRTGPVLVDLAHLNRLNRSNFQTLAAALSARNVGLRFWLPADVDLFQLESFLDFPDQSAELAEQLQDASALVVISPFFLWSAPEITLVEQFVADGGRLLLISDPDIVGDVARDINNLAEPFGVVFNDDHLYDTTRNDENHTHVFQGEFTDLAAYLTGSTIAFYGARSIDGAGTVQVRSASTTLSSLRDGLSEFATVVIAGRETQNTAGRVLVMSDFDVLTAPYVERFDNSQMVEFVADFLADARRADTLASFPAFLGKEVALVYGSAEAIDSVLLQEGSRLQQRLRDTGRHMILGSTALLTPTLVATATAGLPDIVYVADYAAVDEQTTLLHDSGISLVEVIVTPTPEPTPSSTPTPTLTPTSTQTPTATATPAAADSSQVTPAQGLSAAVRSTERATHRPGEERSETPPATATPTQTWTPTATRTPTPTNTPSPTPTNTPTPEIILYLDTDTGLRLLAAETILLRQHRDDGQGRLVVISGQDSEALNAGLGRLLDQNLDDCIVEADLALCPFSPEETATPTPTPTHTSSPMPSSEEVATPDVTATAEGAAEPTATPAGTVEPEPTPAADAETRAILVIDANDEALDSEESEADAYLRFLVANGYAPDLWSTVTQGDPGQNDLVNYAWIIWSDAGYAASQVDIFELDILFQYINEGGRVTISSRRPFIGEAGASPSSVVDVIIAEDLPELVQGLPAEAVGLLQTDLSLAPLDTQVEEGTEPFISLRRGPESEDSEAPILFTLTDEEETEPTGARLMVMGIPVTILPDEFAETLIVNIARWMLSEE